VFNFDFDSVNKESPVIKVGVKALRSYTIWLSFVPGKCMHGLVINILSKSTKEYPYCMFMMSKHGWCFSANFVDPPFGDFLFLLCRQYMELFLKLSIDPPFISLTGIFL
jgi:hypothetical protein